MKNPNPHSTPDLEEKAGYLVLRLKTEEGIIIDGGAIEIRLCSIRSSTEIQIAIKAPKNLPIRRVK